MGDVTRRAWLLFAAMAVIWGIPYLLIKVAVGGLAPETLVFLRTGIGALILVPLAAVRGDLRSLAPYWRWLLAYTVAEVALPWFLLSDAERRLPSSLTGLLIAAVPLIGALLAWVTRGDDRPDVRRLFGLVVGFIGVAALVGLNVSGGDLFAVFEVGLVTLGYAIGPRIISLRLSQAPSMGVVAASLILTALAYAPLGLTHLPASTPNLQVVLAVLGLGVICTALAFLLFFALIAEAGPIRATVITYVNPAVALVLGVVVLNERFTVGAAVGFALILIGSYLSTRRQRPAMERAVAV